MFTVIFAAVLLVMPAPAFADQSHSHQWRKVSEVKGKDAYRNDILVCTWECRNPATQSTHQQQTQGKSFCPRPPSR